jgi:hypothetical protein
MKTLKFKLLTAALLVFSTWGLAQNAKEVFDPKTSLIWLGLDFTGTKFIGDQEKLGSADDVHKLITAWNNLMINEPEKFDVGEALHRPALKQDINIAIAHNEQLNLAGSIEDSGLLHMNREDIVKIASSYDFGSHKEVGALFIVESFSKIEVKAVLWVTFIDMGSKEVLFTNRVTGKPVGFGLRNYWAGAIYGILKQIKINHYDKWKKKNP